MDRPRVQSIISSVAHSVTFTESQKEERAPYIFYTGHNCKPLMFN